MAVISISGTPCTGKSSVARLLAKRLGWEAVDLNRLAERKGLFCGYDRRRRTRIVDVGKVAAEIQQLAQGRSLVIEAHYAHDIPSDIRVVLRCGIEELRKRMEWRGWRKGKIEENIQAEIFGVCAEEARELGNVMEIDTTRKSPSQVAGEIVKGFSRKGKTKGKASR